MTVTFRRVVRVDYPNGEHEYMLQKRDTQNIHWLTVFQSAFLANLQRFVTIHPEYDWDGRIVTLPYAYV